MMRQEGTLSHLASFGSGLQKLLSARNGEMFRPLTFSPWLVWENRELSFHASKCNIHMQNKYEFSFFLHCAVLQINRAVLHRHTSGIPPSVAGSQNCGTVVTVLGYVVSTSLSVFPWNCSNYWLNTRLYLNRDPTDRIIKLSRFLSVFLFPLFINIFLRFNSVCEFYVTLQEVNFQSSYWK